MFSVFFFLFFGGHLHENWGWLFQIWLPYILGQAKDDAESERILVCGPWKENNKKEKRKGVNESGP